jgi:hypothetical protein
MFFKLLFKYIIFVYLQYVSIMETWFPVKLKLFYMLVFTAFIITTIIIKINY